MIYALPFILGVLGRIEGAGISPVSFLPRLLHSLPYGLALGLSFTNIYVSLFLIILGTAVSWAGFNAGTWYFLKWESHEPNTKRGGTLKSINDFIAGLFGYKLGDEGYSWVSCAVKGFIITLPVGGLGAIMWPIGYEIGSHAKGRVSFDPHAISEFTASFLGGISILIFMAVL